MHDPNQIVVVVEFHFRGKKIARACELGPAYQHGPMPSAPSVYTGDNFETTAAKMKAREYSKEQIQAALSQLGYQISNELEDVYGWHGEEREDSAK